jgi:hypothetical protein
MATTLGSWAKSQSLLRVVVINAIEIFRMESDRRIDVRKFMRDLQGFFRTFDIPPPTRKSVINAATASAMWRWNAPKELLIV